MENFLFCALQAPFGKIKSVVLLNGDFNVGAELFLSSFLSFFNQWDRSDRIVWLLNRSMESNMTFPPIATPFESIENLEIIMCPISFYITLTIASKSILMGGEAEIAGYMQELGSQNPLFATDAFTVTWKPEGSASYCVIPRNYPDNDSNLYQLFAGQAFSFQSGVLTKSITLEYDGGNLFACGPVLFAGEDIWLKVLKQNRQNEVSKQVVEAQLCEDFSAQQVIWLKSPHRMPEWPAYEMVFGTEQPLYHADVFFTPLGLIQDSDTQEWSYYVAVADPYWYQPGVGFFDPESESPIIRESFDYVASQLANSSISGVPITVLRLPMVFYYPVPCGFKGFYILMSYLNGLIQNAGKGERVAYLPK